MSFAAKALARHGGRARVPGLNYGVREQAVAYDRTLPVRSTVRLDGGLNDAAGLRVVANRKTASGDDLCRYIVRLYRTEHTSAYSIAFGDDDDFVWDIDPKRTIPSSNSYYQQVTNLNQTVTFNRGAAAWHLPALGLFVNEPLCSADANAELKINSMPVRSDGTAVRSMAEATARVRAGEVICAILTLEATQPIPRETEITWCYGDSYAARRTDHHGKTYLACLPMDHARCKVVPNRFEPPMHPSLLPGWEG